MDYLVGKQIENYRIDEALGSGELGTVYRAIDLETNQPVAFKLVHHQLAQSVVFQQRFIREAQTITQLKHPAIVPIHSFNKQEDLLYIIMELVEGGSLTAHMDRYLHQHHLLDLGEGLNLIAQVAEALGYAHRHGVVHGVLKPENIFVRHIAEPQQKSLQAVVGDLGLSSLLDRDFFTHFGTFRSIWPYLSPEQVSGRYVDGRSDIYTLGIILYELTTGRLPFNIQSSTDAVLAHTRQQPPRPQQIQPQLPHKVEAIILRALEKEPEARFPTAQLMAQALYEASATLMQQPPTAVSKPHESGKLLGGKTAVGTAATTGSLNRGGTQRHSTSGQLSVVLTPQSSEVIPGSEVDIRIDLFSRGAATERFTLGVQGLSPEWFRLSKPTIELAPSGRETVTLTIRPPEDSTARSGLHRFHLLVSSESDSEELAAIAGVVTVKPFARFITSMRPKELVNEGTCYVWIENEGNFETSYTIMGVAADEAVVFDHITPRLNIGPGEEAMATIQVSLKEKPLIGNPDNFPFQIKIATASSKPQLIDAHIEMRPPWPTWVATVVAALLVVLVGLGVGAYSLLDGEVWLEEQTAVAATLPTASSSQPVANSTVETAVQALPTATDAPTSIPSPTIAATDSPPTATPQPLPTAESTETAVAATLPTASSSQPVANSTVETAVVPGLWDGLWASNCDTQSFFFCGNVILSHNVAETAVSGIFADGQGTINAQATDSHLSGTWRYQDTEGTLSFWLSEDGQTWRGSWNRTAAWCGARSDDTIPTACGLADWQGAWQTNCGTGACGTLTLTQNGEEVIGSYANGNGALRGTVVDTTLQGQWLRGTNSGTFHFFLRPGNHRFSGNFDEAHPWCGHDGSDKLPDPCLDVSG